MKRLFWIVTSIMLLSFTQVNERVTELSFIGKWKSFEGEIISVSFNENNQPYFRRFDDNQLVWEGIFAVEENFIVIQRIDTTCTYKLQYAFSKDAHTLVVLKPSSEQAWLLNRSSYSWCCILYHRHILFLKFYYF